MAMSPAMKAALESMNPTLVYLVEIVFQDRTVRLTDGGSVMWGANLFAPEDAELGTIAGFSEFAESEGTESPRLEVSFEYRNNLALTRLATPTAQGTPFNVYAATVNRNTGALIGTPEIQFAGEIDEADLRHVKNNRLLTVSLSTAWELLFDNNEGNRWNNAFWTYLYGTGAQAFYAVTDVQRQLFWGYKGPENSPGTQYWGGQEGYIGGFKGGIFNQR